MQHLVSQAGLDEAIEVDSAGTAAYHTGQRADERSRAVARERGINLPSVARKFTARDWAHFDYVLAMDQDNYDDLAELCENEAQREKLSLLRSFDSTSPSRAGVPDPYYGGHDGFTEVFEICERACKGLLAHIKGAHSLS